MSKVCYLVVNIQSLNYIGPCSINSELIGETTMYDAGTVLKLDFGTFHHFGIADGKGAVIHNSKLRKCVTIDSYEEFADGKKILISTITSINPSQAAIIAARYLGMPYNLIKSNCEHFARVCHGLEKESTQIQQYLLGALGLGIAIQSDNPTVKALGGSVALVSLLTPTEESPFENALIAALVLAGLLLLASSFSD